MSKIISIAIDAMEHDNSPDKTIKIKLFLDKNKSQKDFLINIFGKEDILKEKLDYYKINSNLVNIIHSSFHSF